MGLFETFGADTNKEVNGFWFNLPVKNDDGTQPGFLLARMSSSNPAYLTRVEKLAKDYRREIDLDIMTEEVAAPVMRDIFVSTILLDWRNVFDRDGTELAYSQENAKRLMESLPDLYALLREEAQTLANYREKDIEAAAKN